MRIRAPLRTTFIQPNVKGLRPDELFAIVIRRRRPSFLLIHQVGNPSAHVGNQIAGLLFYVLPRNAFILGCCQTRFRAQARFRVVTRRRSLDWLDCVFANPLFNKASRTISHGKASGMTHSVCQGVTVGAGSVPTRYLRTGKFRPPGGGLDAKLVTSAARLSNNS